ncbi:hypothetical protein [Natronococcus wangiae]|nr:hypothetical protein [Natronococcus sp. AD5]
MSRLDDITLEELHELREKTKGRFLGNGLSLRLAASKAIKSTH